MMYRSKFLVLALLSATAASGDCWYDCMQRSGCWSGAASTTPGLCGYSNSHIDQMCKIECGGASSNTWGAIAYSTKDGIHGWSTHQRDKATAERAAMQSCIKAGGSKCLIDATFNNTCGALAADREIIAWGTSGARLDAQRRAMAECARLGGKKCVLQVTACSTAGARPGPSSITPPGPPRTVSWGAIAFSSSNMSAGWSQGKDDRSTAEKEAMSACSKRGSGCVLRTAFNNQCGALAADRNFAGWASSANQREAQMKAVDDCKKAGGTQCVLRISFCSGTVRR